MSSTNVRSLLLSVILANRASIPVLRGRFWCIPCRDRHAQRQRGDGGRFNNVPFSETDASLVTQFAVSVPCLMLLRQEGLSTAGWRDAPFWWPVLQAPSNMRPVVFSAEVLSDERVVAKCPRPDQLIGIAARRVGRTCSPGQSPTPSRVL